MNKPAAVKPGKLAWLKYNPNEWNGTYSALSDEEYGLLHRVIAKLWSTPGNRLTEAALLADLRVATGSKRARLLHGLIGYALKSGEDGLLYVAAVDDAFADATNRSAAGRAAAESRWASEPPQAPAPADF